jgi:putative ABC transport system permease protein
MNPRTGGLSDRAADLIDDVLVELSNRRARALLMVIAVGLSTGAMLASVGISQAASHQIGSDIAASTLDVVTVSVTPVGNESDDLAAPSDGDAPAHGSQTDSPEQILPSDTEERLARVDLIEAGGRRLDVSRVREPVVSRLPNGHQEGERGSHPIVVAVTADYLLAARAGGPRELLFQMDHAHRVAFLGPAAADTLDVPITDTPTGLQVWVDGVPFDVIGFVEPRGPGALGNAVVIPYARGLAITGDDKETTVLVRSLPGAGARVAPHIAAALRPDSPERLETSQVVSVDSLRRGVSTQMDRLAAWTGVILLALTILLIANSMIVAVTARTPEIGLRRALGSSRSMVASVFLAEGALIGLLGGLVGAAVGAAAVVATAAMSGWTAVFDPLSIALGPAIGTAVGLVASAYPAWRAARVSPSLAVRSE